MLVPVLIRIWPVMLLAGAVGFPALFFVCRRLPDRGYAISRFSGLLLLTYPAWLAAHAGVPFRPATLWLTGALAAVAAIAGYLAQWSEIKPFLKENARYILVSELLLLLSLLFFLAVVGHNPAIDPDSERMMDYAMVQGVLRSDTFPPWDLWLSGERVNYYYFGYALVAVLHLFSGLPLPVLFNAAVGLFHAGLCASAFGLGYNFTRRFAGGLLTAFMILLMGNLNGLVQLLGPRKLFQLDWFASSRVIPGTINEFPYFSFLFGDLHPYVIALPLVMIPFFFSLNILYREDGPPDERRGRAALCLGLLLQAVLAGSLVAVHTWDYAAYSALIFAAWACVALRRKDLSLLSRLRFLLPPLTLFLLGMAAYLPFLADFEQGRAVRLFSGPRSDFSAFFQLFGLQLTVTAVLAFTVLANRLFHGRTREKAMLTMFSFAGCLLVFWQTTWLYLLCLLLAGVAAAWASLADSNASPPPPGGRAGARAYVLLIAALAAGFGLICEFLFVDDHYSGELERMNTVFKVYLEMWVVWSAAASFALCPPVRARGRPRRFPAGRLARWASVVAVLALGSIYPVSATYTRTGGFRGERSLDGLRDVCRAHPADCRAIEWLKQDIRGVPVTLESHGHAYSWHSRFATFAGVPTVLGWGNHEAGWRDDWPEVRRRGADIDCLYRSPDPEDALEVIYRYGVTYVVVGSLEQQKYPPAGLEKFRHILDTAYDRDGVFIYRVRQ